MAFLFEIELNVIRSICANNENLIDLKKMQFVGLLAMCICFIHFIAAEKFILIAIESCSI